MSSNIHVGNIGTSFRIAVTDENGVVDLTGATIEILLWKPDGSVLTKVAALVTDGTDGLMEYVTVDGDLDADGVWKVQGHITFVTTEFYTDITNVRIYPNLA